MNKAFVSPANTLSKVSVGDRIESFIVCISNTEKDLILCFIGNFYLVRKWWF